MRAAIYFIFSGGTPQARGIAAEPRRSPEGARRDGADSPTHKKSSDFAAFFCGARPNY
jgi:hypothetical protein